VVGRGEFIETLRLGGGDVNGLFQREKLANSVLRRMAREGQRAFALRRGAALFASLLLVFFPWSRCFAEPRRLSLRDFAGDLSIFRGQEFQVDAKIRFVVAKGYVLLLECDQKFYFDLRSALGQQLSNDKDEKGERLRSKASNVRIIGRVEANRDQLPQAQASEATLTIVTSLQRLPEDVPWFEERLKASLAADPKGYRALLALADEANEWASRYGLEESLKDWAKASSAAGLTLWESQIAEDAFEQRLELVREFYRRLGDQAKAIAMGEALFKKFTKPEQRKVLNAEISRWGGFFHRGRWIPEAEFKVAEGFVRGADGAWIRKEKAELLAVIEEDRSAAPDPFIPSSSEFEIAAAQGKVLRLMRADDILSLTIGGAALGYPRYVERVRANDRDYTLWLYAGQRFYFRDGRLIKWFLEPLELGGR
jgi:hypothetical protein